MKKMKQLSFPFSSQYDFVNQLQAIRMTYSNSQNYQYLCRVTVTHYVTF